jgi:glucose/mannose-6-phosphate isomerase
MSSTILSLTEGFGQQLSHALELGNQFNFRQINIRSLEKIVLLGMGGSAFGGEFVKDYIADQCRLPFLIHRNYSLPAYVDDKTLVIASSYSGSTEETLTALHAAIAKKAQVIGICSEADNPLRQLGKQHGFDVLSVPAGFPPRMAFPYSMVLQLIALSHYQLIPSVAPALKQGIDLVKRRQQTARTMAQELTTHLKGKLIVIYCAAHMESLAIRLRQQINENAKQLCWHHIVPEMNHNELVGWRFPTQVMPHIAVLQLRSQHEHPRNSQRFEVMNPIIEQAGVQIHSLKIENQHKLAEMLFLIHICDFLSCMLADENQVDAMPVEVINHLKSELAKYPF